MFCKFCGKEIQDDWMVCPYCGKKDEPATAVNQQTFNPAQYNVQPQQYNPQPAVNYQRDFIQMNEPKKKNVNLPLVIVALVLVIAIILGAIFIPGMLKKDGGESASAGGENTVWVIGRINKDGTETVFDYDASGNIVSEAEIKDYKEIKKRVWTYNADNKPDSMVYYSNGKEHAHYTYTYDSVGNHIETFYQSLVGDGSTTYTYSYDSAGRLIKATAEATFLDDPDDYTTYKYDSNGRLIQEVICKYESWSSEFRIETIIYEYDANGNLIKETVKGEYISEGCYDAYEYDNSGRCISKVEYSDGEEYARCTYEYDGNGNCIKASGNTSDNYDEVNIEYIAITVSPERIEQIKENQKKVFDDNVYLGGL